MKETPWLSYPDTPKHATTPTQHVRANPPGRGHG
ncbi:MAG: hypothetical protein QOG69_2483, partial [Actinomycetota bacterium]|nr:hypothetical protein [Actinomycetota bacterium]